MPPPGAAAGKNAGNPLEKAWSEGWTAKWAELVEKADAWNLNGECAPWVRVFRMLPTNELDHIGDDMPLDELVNACSWLAGVHGPGRFRLDVLDSRGARTLGYVVVHVGADKRGKRPPASPVGPGAPIGDPAAPAYGVTLEERFTRLERMLMGGASAYHPPAPPPDPVAQVSQLAGVLSKLPQAAGMAQPATPDIIERAVRFGAEMAAKQLVNAVAPAAPSPNSPWWSEHLDTILGAGNTAIEKIFDTVEKVVKDVTNEKLERHRRPRPPAATEPELELDADEIDAEVVDATPTPASSESRLADSVRRAAEANAKAPATEPDDDDDDDDDDDGGNEGGSTAAVH